MKFDCFIIYFFTFLLLYSFCYLIFTILCLNILTKNKSFIYRVCSKLPTMDKDTHFISGVISVASETSCGIFTHNNSCLLLLNISLYKQILLVQDYAYGFLFWWQSKPSLSAMVPCRGWSSHILPATQSLSVSRNQESQQIFRICDI